MRKIILFLFVVAIVPFSCRPGKSKDPHQNENQLPGQYKLTEIWRTDTLLMTPESVIHDRKREVLYVSNLNFEPRKKDGNGFISILSKEGKILNLRWIEGMSSPKGMAIIGDTLFTTDVDELVVMDIIKGQIIKKIPIEGAGMLNDITADKDGNLFIADTDANKIHIYSKGLITEWMNEGLNGPNGLLAENGRILVASQGSSDLRAIDASTKNITILAEGIGRGDGIVYTGKEGYYIATDWSGEIFIIYPDHTRHSLLDTKLNQSNTADVEFIQQGNILFVPTFFKNCVVAYRLDKNSAEQP